MTDLVEGMSPELREHNISVLRAAAEDMNHRNLARIALLRDNYNQEISLLDLLSIKIDFLFNVIVGGDEYVQCQAEFQLQEFLSQKITVVEHAVMHDHNVTHDHETIDNNGSEGTDDA